MRVNLLAMFLLSVSLSTVAGGQHRGSKPSDTSVINLSARQIDQFIKRNPKGRRIFADVASGASDEPSRWQEFKTEAAREKADTGDNLNENAYVWLKAGKVVGVNFTFQSPSRDWAHFAMYYFREDGTLAKIQSQLNSFYGDMTVRRESFFKSDGQLLHTTVKYFDLNSQKPKKPEKDFPEFPVPVYKKVQDLPFYKLL